MGGGSVWSRQEAPLAVLGEVLLEVRVLQHHQDACLPAGGQGAVDGGTLGLGDGVQGVAVAMANHHLDGHQLVVWWTVTCERRPSSGLFRNCEPQMQLVVGGGVICLTLPGLFAAVGGVAVAVGVPDSVGSRGVCLWEDFLPTLGQFHAVPGLPGLLQWPPFGGGGGDEVHWGAERRQHQDASGSGCTHTHTPPQTTSVAAKLQILRL